MRCSLGVGTAIALLAAQIGAGPASAQAATEAPRFDKHGTNNAITDVPGILVGQVTRNDPPFLTGVTAVYAPDGAVGGAIVPGGWPGSINVEVLQPGKNDQESHVMFLTGGSYFGLGSFSGIMRWLEEHGVGMNVGTDPLHVDPLVSGAVVFDLLRGGDFKARPDADFGYQAMENAKSGPVEQGNVGAGTGTRSGGKSLPLKGGIGTASVELDNGIIVGAITAVNAVGTPVDFSDCSLRAVDLAIGDEFGAYKSPSREECDAALEKAKIDAETGKPHANTTIGVLATNAKLDKEQVKQLAEAVSRGHGRAIDPIHLISDGDSYFTLATGEVTADDAQIQQIYAAAENAFARAIVHATLKATSVGEFVSYCDTFPSACGAQ
ncbi:P1 family peptidase [Paracoccus suum]|nr:P1 family peptidase [Paracoccus suum]